jgi:hypothetical protein
MKESVFCDFKQRDPKKSVLIWNFSDYEFYVNFLLGYQDDADDENSQNSGDKSAEWNQQPLRCRVQARRVGTVSLSESSKSMIRQAYKKKSIPKSKSESSSEKNVPAKVKKANSDDSVSVSSLSDDKKPKAKKPRQECPVWSGSDDSSSGGDESSFKTKESIPESGKVAGLRKLEFPLPSGDSSFQEKSSIKAKKAKTRTDESGSVSTLSQDKKPKAKKGQQKDRSSSSINKTLKAKKLRQECPVYSGSDDSSSGGDESSFKTKEFIPESGKVAGLCNLEFPLQLSDSSFQEKPSTKAKKAKTRTDESVSTLSQDKKSRAKKGRQKDKSSPPVSIAVGPQEESDSESFLLYILNN